MEEQKKKVQFVVHNFNTSNAPQYIEKLTRAGYIAYGEDNLYPDYLRQNPTQQAAHRGLRPRQTWFVFVC